jgi:hypothetical protein
LKKLQLVSLALLSFKEMRLQKGYQRQWSSTTGVLTEGCCGSLGATPYDRYVNNKIAIDQSTGIIDWHRMPVPRSVIQVSQRIQDWA